MGYKDLNFSYNNDKNYMKSYILQAPVSGMPVTLNSDTFLFYNYNGENEAGRMIYTPSNSFLTIYNDNNEPMLQCGPDTLDFRSKNYDRGSVYYSPSLFRVILEDNSSYSAQTFGLSCAFANDSRLSVNSTEGFYLYLGSRHNSTMSFNQMRFTFNNDYFSLNCQPQSLLYTNFSSSYSDYFAFEISSERIRYALNEGQIVFNNKIQNNYPILGLYTNINNCYLSGFKVLNSYYQSTDLEKISDNDVKILLGYDEEKSDNYDIKVFDTLTNLAEAIVDFSPDIPSTFDSLYVNSIQFNGSSIATISRDNANNAFDFSYKSSASASTASHTLLGNGLLVFFDLNGDGSKTNQLFLNTGSLYFHPDTEGPSYALIQAGGTTTILDGAGNILDQNIAAGTLELMGRVLIRDWNWSSDVLSSTPAYSSTAKDWMKNTEELHKMIGILYDKLVSLGATF